MTDTVSYNITRATADELLHCAPPALLVVNAAWSAVECRGSTRYELWLRPPINAINGAVAHASRRHHAAFYRGFMPWRGLALVSSGVLVDFLGMAVPFELYCNRAYLWQVEAHALRVRQCNVYMALQATLRAETRARAGAVPVVPLILQTAWPVVSEEYFEYADVLDAVADYVEAFGAAHGRGEKVRPLTVIELGCGYGHWAFSAHAALKQRMGAAPHRYLLVDVLPRMRMHVDTNAVLNGVQPDNYAFHAGYVSSSGSSEEMQKRMRMQMYKMRRKYMRGWRAGDGVNASLGGSEAEQQAAPVAARRRGRVLRGAAPAVRARPGPRAAASKLAAVERAASITFTELLRRYRVPQCIDLLDIDVQGGEYPVSPHPNGTLTPDGPPGLFADEAFLRVLRERVVRVHVGMHAAGEGALEADAHMAELLERTGFRVGWRYHADREPEKRTDTEYGTVKFGDGILSGINTQIPAACARAGAASS